MIAKSRNNKSLAKKAAGKASEQNSVKWQAVSAEAGLEDDFDKLFQRQTTSKADNGFEGDDANKVFDGQDLSNHDFSYQNLDDASFKNCNLTGANFSYASLKNANFTGANLTSVILKEADIENAILLDIKIDELGLEELQALIEFLAKYYPHKLNLLNINLTLLDLRRIDLSKINLAGIDFTGCDMTGVNILDLDLSSCIISPEQINQALGRPPTALEMQKMFMPRKGKGFSLSNFAKQMEKLFQSDGTTWGVIDVTKDKGVAIEDLMKFGKKVYKALAGKPDPKLEEIQENIQKNMDSRKKEINDDKKKIIEEKKREMLEKMQTPEREVVEKEPMVIEKKIEKQKSVQKDINIKMIEKIRAKERA